jgi:hypothetical protein
VFEVERGSVIWTEVWDKEFTTMLMKRVGMAVGSRAFVRFETFNGSVYLLVGDVFECGAGLWVLVVQVNVVVLWGGKEKGVV